MTHDDRKDWFLSSHAASAGCHHHWRQSLDRKRSHMQFCTKCFGIRWPRKKPPKEKQ